VEFVAKDRFHKKFQNGNFNGSKSYHLKKDLMCNTFFMLDATLNIAASANP
jgi:hypothetical protein